MDLSLVPFDDLIEEMETRCDSFIAAYKTLKDKDKTMFFQYGKGNWYDACILASILNNDVLNNWDGELKTLKKINGEEQKGE